MLSSCSTWRRIHVTHNKHIQRNIIRLDSFKAKNCWRNHYSTWISSSNCNETYALSYAANVDSSQWKRLSYWVSCLWVLEWIDGPYVLRGKLWKWITVCIFKRLTSFSSELIASNIAFLLSYYRSRLNECN